MNHVSYALEDQTIKKNSGTERNFLEGLGSTIWGMCNYDVSQFNSNVYEIIGIEYK